MMNNDVMDIFCFTIVNMQNGLDCRKLFFDLIFIGLDYSKLFLDVIFIGLDFHNFFSDVVMSD